MEVYSHKTVCDLGVQLIHSNCKDLCVRLSAFLHSCVWSINAFEQTPGHSHELACEPKQASSSEWTKYLLLIYVVNRL